MTFACFFGLTQGALNNGDHLCIAHRPEDHICGAKTKSLNRIRFLPPSEHSDELFFAEATRHVKKDNTFSFHGRRYETPVDLRNKEVQLRYDRCRSESSVVILYYKNERLGAARLLDAVANGLLRRKEQA